MLGLELTDPGFDYSILSEFRSRLVANGAENQLLETILQLCKKQGLIKAGGRQRTDSTHVLAAVRTLSRVERVAETLRHALDTLAVVAPDWLRSWVPADWAERYGRRCENYRFPKAEAQHRQMIQIIGEDGRRLLGQVDAADDALHLASLAAVQTLRQVWKEQYTDPPDPPRFREGKEAPPAAEQIVSPYDTEARFSTKRGFSWTGYKVHFTETCNPDQPSLICNVHTTAASTADDNQLPIIHQALAHRQLLPAEHLVDAGYTDAQVLLQSHQNGVQVIGPVALDPSWQARSEKAFDKGRFLVDWQAQQVTCPQGKRSIFWRPRQHASVPGGVIGVYFSKADCRACVARTQCTHAPTAARSLTLLPQEQQETLTAARARQQTTAFQDAYAVRAGIEATHAQGVRRCGLRRSRYLGLAKTHLQNVLTAAALNLVRIGAWLSGSRKGETTVTRFAALMAA